MFSASLAIPVQLDAAPDPIYTQEGCSALWWVRSRRAQPRSLAYLWRHLNCPGHGGVPQSHLLPMAGGWNQALAAVGSGLHGLQRLNGFV